MKTEQGKRLQLSRLLWRGEVGGGAFEKKWTTNRPLNSFIRLGPYSLHNAVTALTQKGTRTGYTCRGNERPERHPVRQVGDCLAAGVTVGHRTLRPWPQSSKGFENNEVCRLATLALAPQS